MKASIVVFPYVLFCACFCRPTSAEDDAKRYWLDEIAGPVSEVTGKGINLSQKQRQLVIVEEDGRGAGDGRMTRWVRIYKTQHPWMLLVSAEEKWERTYKRAASRNFSEHIVRQILSAPRLHAAWNNPSMPFNLPFRMHHLERVADLASYLNEIPMHGETDSGRIFYQEEMPHPYLLFSAPNDYNSLEIVTGIRPWLTKGSHKTHAPDFHSAFHQTVTNNLQTYGTKSPLRQIRVPLISKWQGLLGKEIASIRTRYGECKLLYTGIYGRSNEEDDCISCRTYSFMSGNGRFHTVQPGNGMETVYKIQIARDYYLTNEQVTAAERFFNPERTWGSHLGHFGLQRVSSNICVMIANNPMMFHRADMTKEENAAGKEADCHYVSWMTLMPPWFLSTFSTDIQDLGLLSCVDHLPKEMFRVPYSTTKHER